MTTVTVETTTTNADEMDSKYASDIQTGVQFYRENSEIKSNGMRVIPKSAYTERLETQHGVTDKMVKQVHNALEFETTVAANLALSDVVDRIAEATPEQKADVEYRKGLESSVRLPTYGGNTEVTVKAEHHANNPFRLDSNGEKEKTVTFGRTSTTVNTKMRIHKGFHEDAHNRVRESLGLKD